jgi:hypothetical protein
MNRLNHHHHRNHGRFLLLSLSRHHRQNNKYYFSTLNYTPADPKTLDWSNLGFGHVPTKTTIFTHYVEGKGWSPLETSSEPFVKIHALSNVLHYGQACTLPCI